jgi:hypothetical protein
MVQEVVPVEAVAEPVMVPIFRRPMCVFPGGHTQAEPFPSYVMVH